MSKRRLKLAVWTVAGLSGAALTFGAVAAYGYYVLTGVVHLPQRLNVRALPTKC